VGNKGSCGRGDKADGSCANERRDGEGDRGISIGSPEKAGPEGSWNVYTISGERLKERNALVFKARELRQALIESDSNFDETRIAETETKGVFLVWGKVPQEALVRRDSVSERRIWELGLSPEKLEVVKEGVKLGFLEVVGGKCDVVDHKDSATRVADKDNNHGERKPDELYDSNITKDPRGSHEAPSSSATPTNANDLGRPTAKEWRPPPRGTHMRCARCHKDKKGCSLAQNPTLPCQHCADKKLPCEEGEPAKIQLKRTKELVSQGNSGILSIGRGELGPVARQRTSKPGQSEHVLAPIGHQDDVAEDYEEDEILVYKLPEVNCK
jgi:hypothetical protein